MVSARILAVVVFGSLAVFGCGGDDDDGDAGPSGDSGSGDVVSPQAPGEALVSVDSKEFKFSEPGGVGCNVTKEGFSFSFRIGDNEVTLGAGAVYAGDMWVGEIRMTVANPEGERGPIDYFVSLPEIDEPGLAFDGKSMSYSGPMKKQPPQDGTNPAPVDVGTGTVSITCP